jgi:UDP-glucose 4-epimerase
MDMNKVLITGGSGFLGKYIVKEFIDQGWKVTSVDMYKNDDAKEVDNFIMQLPSTDFSDLLLRIKPDLIIHAAGTASVPNSMIDPLGDFGSNVELTAGILNAIHRCCPYCKTIYISSAAVYGNPTRLPIQETDPIIPISPYGYNKHLGELLIEEYYRIFNLPGCCVRLFSAYGSGLRRQILWDVCQKLTKQHEVRLMGNGVESRDMIHAIDVAKAVLLLAMNATFHGEIYNLASGTQVTIREIAEELIRIFDVSVPLIFTGERRLGDPLYWQADISRISKLGFKTTIGIKDGLNEYATWFLNNGC